MLRDLEEDELGAGDLGPDGTYVPSPGSHAFVRCYGEPHLRVTLHAFPFGAAGGHPALANHDMVLMAGELEVDEHGKLTRWLNKSGL